MNIVAVMQGVEDGTLNDAFPDSFSQRRGGSSSQVFSVLAFLRVVSQN